MKAKAIAIGFVVALTAGLSAPVSAQSVGGRYQVEGKNPNGTSYRGTADIAITSATTCRITWRIGTQTWRGICMRNANSFATSYALGRTYGLVIYEIKQDGTLDGIWTIADRDGAGTEVLIPLQ